MDFIYVQLEFFYVNQDVPVLYWKHIRKGG